MKKAFPLLLAAFCGIFSFLIDFLVIPYFCVGWVDWVWMVLRILLPAALAALLSPWITPKTIWIGLPVQLLLLIVFAEPVCALLGISTGGLGGFAYLAEFIKPFGTTAWQCLVICVVRKVRKVKKG